MMSITYKINELFETLQGEGSFTGQPSIFIRLQECPVGCSWCDTKHTWEVKPELKIEINDLLAQNEETECWSELNAEQIITLFKKQEFNAKHVVITGGEPCMYDLKPLCQALELQGFSCQIETSGTFEIKTTDNCWVTVSPKVNMKGGYPILASAMARANEIKHPVATEQHVDDLKALLAKFNVTDKQVYLQPISQKQRATELAIRTCIENDWRLSVQVHKYIGIE
ncbi:7-carboxy-7-deazaguanine synthase QueE [Thalassotalea atypica]|uniref:7-carboxy-7-deazaguanine synthase QueE n=1 Tax=Thalassotalea atypica TaxID=2054316 RepID=UPI002573179A|nr:7-carboxy-7-deazaguanine synthase QueE [Thalassotalea atypica]